MRRQFLPDHRETGEVERLDGIGDPDDPGHRLAAETRLVLGEDRLVGEGRNDAIAVDPRHVAGGQHALDTRMRGNETAEIAKGETRPVIGRSEEHTSELQSLMRNAYAVFSLKK